MSPTHDGHWDTGCRMEFAIDSEQLSAALERKRPRSQSQWINDGAQNYVEYPHRHHDPLEDLSTSSSSVNSLYSEGPGFLTECELQLRKLFAFVELHLSNVESRLADALVQSQSEQSINSSQDLSSSQNATSSAETEESYSPAFLRRLKEVLLSLQKDLDTNFSSLEALVRIYDERSLGKDGRNYLRSKRVRRKRFEDRINSCMAKIDSRLHKPSDSLEGRYVRKHRIGYFTILHFLLFIATCASFTYLYYADITNTWTVLLRLARSPLLIVFYLYSFGANIKLWMASKLNYTSIFHFPANGVPTPKYISKVTGLFTLYYSTIIILLIYLTVFLPNSIPFKVFPLVMWLSLIAFLVNPLRVCLHSGRKAFLLSLVKMLSAPFYRISFGDVWLAIQINSFVAILLDLEYLVCYTLLAPWRGEMDKDICTGSSNGIRPIIAALPALLQLLQNLRAFYDDRKSKYIINAFKFSSTLPVVLFAALLSFKLPVTGSLYSLKFVENGWVFGGWVLFSFINGLFAFLWDVRHDWGLLQLSKGTLLRPNRLYRWTGFYYIAIVLDLVLQFTWTLNLTLGIVWRLNVDVIFTGLVIGEIVRLFVWNLLRVEFLQVQRMAEHT